MIVYEVNLRVRREIGDEYRAWLGPHVEEILRLPGFLAAETFAVPDADDADAIALCVQYRLRDAQALEHYLLEHAPRLRDDGRARFGDRYAATRRVLVPAGA